MSPKLSFPHPPVPVTGREEEVSSPELAALGSLSLSLSTFWF